MPPSIDVEMAEDFTVYVLKAGLNGSGNDIVELARANLLR